MARDILDLGADVFDDTVVASKHRISPKKRNYIIGLSITGVLLAGLITFTVIASNTFLLDVTNLEKIQFIYTPSSMLEEGEEQTLTLFKLDPNTKYPSTFRIPEKVKGYRVAHIGEEAFVNHPEIKKVIFTKYVKTIGDRAFSNCTGLEKFTWNKALTEIGSDAFFGTKFLNNLQLDSKGFYKIPSGVLVYVGKDYFPANSALVPGTLTAEEMENIKSTYGLSDGNLYTFENLQISNLTSGLFKNNTNIVYADFPSFLTKVGKDLFSGANNLKGVDFSHSNVTVISDSAFKNCPSLNFIKFSDKLTSIGDDAFAETAITSVPELHNITEMGSGIFRNCHNLTSVVYPVSETIRSVPTEMFYGCSALNTIKWGDIGNSKVDLMESFGYGAFAKTAFVTFDVPKNVTAILDNTFTDCTALETVTFYGPVDDNDIIPGTKEEGITHMGADGKEKEGQLVGIADIRSNAFSNDLNLSTIRWVDQNGTIHGDYGEFTFPRSLQNTSADSFNLPNNRTFEGTSAKKVTIGNNLMSIGSYAFAQMTELEAVEFEDYSVLRNIGSNAFENDVKIESISLPDSLINLGSSSFKDCTSLKTIDFNQAEVTGIRPYTFENCINLEDFKLPETISAIYEGAFKGTRKLQQVIIPENVTQINAEAFYNVREEGATDKLEILMEIPYANMRYVNAKDWYQEEQAYVSFKLGENEAKLPGISYWKGDNDAPVIIKLTNVDFSGTLAKTSYTAGEAFDSTGLTINASYDDSTSIVITDANIEWNPLQAGDTEATGTYTVGAVSKTITVTGITVS